MRNTIIITILLFIAVIGASVYYFTDLNQEKTETVKPLTFLPKETFLITAFHNDVTTDNIFKDFEIFEAILGKRQMIQLQRFKSKILRHSTIQPFVAGVEMYISFHPTSEGQGLLFTIPTVEKIKMDNLDELVHGLDKAFNITTKDTLNHRIFSFDEGIQDSTLHITLHQDVFFASYSTELLAKIIDEKTRRIESEHIKYFAENNSRNSPLSVYFVHNQIPEIAKHLMRRKYGKLIALFDSLGGQSSWNLNFKNDALILSGESEVDRKEEKYIELFGTQSKTTQRLYNFFPENTASYISFSISHNIRFQQELDGLLEKSGELRKIKNQLSEMEKNKKVSFEQDVRPVFGNEFAVVEQRNQTELAFIALSDSSLFEKNKEKFASEDGDSIFRLDYSNILYALYGEPLKSFARPYFIRLEDIIVLSNHQSVLRQYQADWERANLLVSTIGFKNFERIQGNEANVTYFIRTRSSSSIISNTLKPTFSSLFRDTENYGFEDFYSWSMQLSGNNGNFLSSIYGIYKSKNALGTTPEWTYEFNNRPITQPWVFEHSDTSQFILIQEQDHTFHGIHPSGSKMWSTVFSGRAVGQAQQLADRSIVLVTDRNRLYRFDTNGKPLNGFSVGLPYEPTYSPTIAQLNGQDFIFIPAGEHLLVYTIDGKPADDWKNISLKGKISFDIKILNNNVFIGTDNGHFYQFDAQGKVAKEEAIESGFKNPILLTSNEQKHIFLHAVDTAGNLFSIDFNSKATRRKWASWNKHTLISFDNIHHTSSPDLIVLNDKKLSVYNLTDSIEIFGHTFTREIADRPQFFKNSSSGPLLGIASRSNYLIYLFDEKGAVYDGFPIEALPLFYYGKIDYNSPDYLLCVRRDRKLYAFKK